MAGPDQQPGVGRFWRRNRSFGRLRLVPSFPAALETGAQRPRLGAAHRDREAARLATKCRGTVGSRRTHGRAGNGRAEFRAQRSGGTKTSAGPKWVSIGVCPAQNGLAVDPLADCGIVCADPDFRCTRAFKILPQRGMQVVFLRYDERQYALLVQGQFLRKPRPSAAGARGAAVGVALLRDILQKKYSHAWKRLAFARAGQG